MSLGLYSAGYSLFYVEERYLWAMWVLIILMGGYVLNIFFKTEFFTNKVRRLLLVIVFSASIVFPALVGLIESNYKMRRIGGNINTFSSLLINDGLTGTRIASNTDYGTGVGLAYRLGAKFYGVAATRYQTENEIVEELKKNGIQYYLVIYEPGDDNPSLQLKNPSLVKVKELQGNNLILDVYSVIY
jgi:hypothetical protein